MPDFTKDQARALEDFDNFRYGLNDKTVFALLGYAGCGKSFTAAHMLGELGEDERVLWMAPTWKALEINRKFISGMDIRIDKIGLNNAKEHDGFVLSTIQSALGIGPVIGGEEETGNKQQFGAIKPEKITKWRPRMIFVDEVSMVSWRHLKQLIGLARLIEAQVVLIGDPGQLPPVNEKEIPWDKIQNKAMLTEIVRQSGGSNIPALCEVVRKGQKPIWESVGDVEVCDNSARAFMDRLQPLAFEEEDRSVYLAYRNTIVDAMQERACMKMYGHGRSVVDEGEIIQAQNTIYSPDQFRPPLITNQEQLVVQAVERGQYGRFGRIVTVKKQDGEVVPVEVLTLQSEFEEWKRVVRAAKTEALRIQSDYNSGGATLKRSIDAARRAAWRVFYGLRDQSVLLFAHPFALTIHKSQGSTYREAFVNYGDAERAGPRGMYVACSRPSDKLVLG